MISTQDSNPNDAQMEGGNIFSPSIYESNGSVNKETFWKKVADCLQSILNSEFVDDSKRQFRMHPDRISFACVYCGDSTKDLRKKRGNIFQATLQYHCFNGDCNTHMSLYRFLEDKKMLNNFTVDEQVFLKTESSNRTINLKKIRSTLGMESFFSDEITDLTVDREFLMTKMGLQEIRGSRIERYLRERLQSNFRKFGWDPKKGLLYVFNMNKEEDRIIGLQIKTFNKRNPYLTWKISKIHQELGIFKEENMESLEKLDILSNIFGILQVDLNKPITAFEGPLDSFLFPNSVGLCSAKNSLPFEIDGSRFFYDNDRTGREWSVRRITEGKSVFLWRKFIEENKLKPYEDKIKDLNDLLIMLKRHNLKCRKFIDYFSTDKYDLIWI